jgi:hypothetical protein
LLQLAIVKWAVKLRRRGKSRLEDQLSVYHEGLCPVELGDSVRRERQKMRRFVLRVGGNSRELAGIVESWRE